MYGNRNPHYRPRYTYRRKKWYQTGTGWTIAIVLLFVVIFVGSCAPAYYSEDPITITVTGKESVNTSDGHEYRVYSDTEVYVMKDSIVKGRFRTANDYAALQQGKSYTCTKFGMRVPLFSMFENIKDCRPA